MSDTPVDLDKSMDFDVKENRIKCTAKKTIGWIEKTIPFAYKGNPVFVQMNPVLFTQVLDKATSMRVSENAALFLSGSFKHAISLT